MCSFRITLCRANASCVSRSNLSSLVSVDLGDIRDQVAHTAGIAPLVVVPANELDEVRVERDTGLGVEDGRVGVAVHVCGDDIILSVLNDTFQNVSLGDHTERSW